MHLHQSGMWASRTYSNGRTGYLTCLDSKVQSYLQQGMIVYAGKIPMSVRLEKNAMQQWKRWKISLRFDTDSASPE